MNETIQQLNMIVKEFSIKFLAISDEDFLEKPLVNKWSKQEVVGHLIDSGMNNLRRFICGQYESIPPKIVYNQDYWVSISGYQSMKKHDIINLWKLTNERIAAVLSNMPEKNYTKQCETSELRTLAWLAEDYVQHLKHHLNQIISGSFDLIYK